MSSRSTCSDNFLMQPWKDFSKIQNSFAFTTLMLQLKGKMFLPKIFSSPWGICFSKDKAMAPQLFGVMFCCSEEGWHLEKMILYSVWLCKWWKVEKKMGRWKDSHTDFQNSLPQKLFYILWGLFFLLTDILGFFPYFWVLQDVFKKLPFILFSANINTLQNLSV